MIKALIFVFTLMITFKLFFDYKEIKDLKAEIESLEDEIILLNKDLDWCYAHMPNERPANASEVKDD